MAYVRSRRSRNDTKDVLGLALKTLHIGEELVCTNKSYLDIHDKIEAFRQYRGDVKIAVITHGNLRTIRRVS